MTTQEVGRWKCGKCGKTIVAAGVVSQSLKGCGAFTGPCPWDCGAWVNRSFRSIRSDDVRAYRADEWDQRPLGHPPATAAHWTA
jgi:hypothetical protein